MQEHPITTSILHKGLGSLLLLLAIAIQCALLTLYGDLPLSITLIDSLLSIALFAVAGYYLWYVQCTLHIMQARVAFAVLVQIACIAGCSILLQIFGLEDWEEFSITIPFRFLFGLMAWIILSQWYASRERKSEAASSSAAPASRHLYLRQQGQGHPRRPVRRLLLRRDDPPPQRCEHSRHGRARARPGPRAQDRGHVPQHRV